jgi:ferredoxin-NADP reductase
VLVPVRRKRIAPHRPGQFVTLRAAVPGAGRVVRSYSLSSAGRGDRLRISVKRESDGIMSRHLHAALDPGETIELSGPSGTFVLGDERCRPVVLISAGIGATPVLAMLHALAERDDPREVWWVHGARNGREHSFRAEVRALIERLDRARVHVRYSRPDAHDLRGRDFDAAGRITAETLLELDVPVEAEFRLCGPDGFVADLSDGLRRAGIDAAAIAIESFGGAPAGRAAPVPKKASPKAAAEARETGGEPSVVFARSNVTTRWDGAHASLLELAEANAVPTTSGCRIGACHGCRATVLDGAVRHHPEPIDPPPVGSALLCCARPEGDVVLDV